MFDSAFLTHQIPLSVDEYRKLPILRQPDGQYRLENYIDIRLIRFKNCARWLCLTKQKMWKLGIIKNELLDQ